MLCQSYCEHGGRCSQLPGHEGSHDSGYCRWDDAHGITKAEADARLASQPGGSAYLGTLGVLSDLIEGMIDDEG